MKARFLSLCLCLAAAACAQTAPPPPGLSPDTVIASFGNGEKITYDDLRRYLNFLPPERQQLALRDRKAFVEQFALMRRLADIAEEAKLDQESPTREELRLNRMYIMMTAQVNHAMNDIIVPNADVQKYYDQHKDRFQQVKVKVIYVSFTANGGASPQGKKYLTEPEAKVKIEKIREQIHNETDFVKMVKENSEDQTSAAKDGDFGTIRRTDNIPQPIRDAIFALKPGQVSAPVRQPNGYYLFRAEEISLRPFAEVRDEIFSDLKTERFNQWMQQTKEGLNVKVENPTFFAPPPPSQASK